MISNLIASRGDKMPNYDNAGNLARNTKTGTFGIVICEYNRISDGKPIFEVKCLSNNKTAHWASSAVEVHAK